MSRPDRTSSDEKPEEDADGAAAQLGRTRPSFLGGDDPDPSDWLSAIIEGSDDAIISKDLSGRIRSWNPGAERLFGYSAQEIVGRPITLLIPEDRLDEEPRILAQIRAGRRVEHFETVRRRKDGAFVDLSLTISPIRNEHGAVVGASKIARDISERRRLEEERELVLGEMNHRVKNVFALAGSLVALAARSAATPADLASSVADRLAALSRAHSLTMASGGDMASVQATGLHALLHTLLAPFGNGEGGRARYVVEGDDRPVPADLVTPLSLLLHEFATNAVKYGALSAPEGTVQVVCANGRPGLNIRWTERGGPDVRVPETEGFGSRLLRSSATRLGHLDIDWDSRGVVIDLLIDGRALET